MTDTDESVTERDILLAIFEQVATIRRIVVTAAVVVAVLVALQLVVIAGEVR